MEKVDIKPDVSLRLPNPLLCAICGAQNANIHYQGLACRNCSMFFVRTVTRGFSYICERGNKCVIKPGNRSACKACRFAKCIAAKMNKNEVGCRGKTFCSKDVPVVGYITEEDVVRHMRSVNESYPVGLQLRSAKIGSVHEYTMELAQIERFCNHDHEYFGSKHKVSLEDCNLNISVDNLLKSPTSCCERTPMGWNGIKPVTISALDVEAHISIYCRTVTHYADWLAGCTSLDDFAISMEDRIVLCKESFSTVSTLTNIYHSYVNGTNGFILAQGYELIVEPKPNMTVFDRFMYDLCTYLKTNVISVFKKFSITEGEYCLLKIILLFSVGYNFSDRTMETIKRIREKHVALLLEYIKLTKPYLNTAECIIRVSAILSPISHLLITGNIQNTHLSHMVLASSRFRNQLSLELHTLPHVPKPRVLDGGSSCLFEKKLI